jgi:hypothetical protein
MKHGAFALRYEIFALLYQLVELKCYTKLYEIFTILDRCVIQKLVPSWRATMSAGYCASSSRGRAFAAPCMVTTSGTSPPT